MTVTVQEIKIRTNNIKINSMEDKIKLCEVQINGDITGSIEELIVFFEDLKKTYDSLIQNYHIKDGVEWLSDPVNMRNIRDKNDVDSFFKHLEKIEKQNKIRIQQLYSSHSLMITNLNYNSPGTMIVCGAIGVWKIIEKFFTITQKTAEIRKIETETEILKTQAETRKIEAETELLKTQYREISKINLSPIFYLIADTELTKHLYLCERDDNYTEEMSEYNMKVINEMAISLEPLNKLFDFGKITNIVILNQKKDSDKQISNSDNNGLPTTS